MRVDGYTIVKNEDLNIVKIKDKYAHNFGMPIFFKKEEDAKKYMRKNNLKVADYSIENVERDGFGYLLKDNRYIGSNFASRITYRKLNI